MTSELTADDLVPIIAKLSPKEKRRLIQLAFSNVNEEASRYDTSPVEPTEFSSDDDALAWDAEGWEDVE